jgi:hypothetical protein
MGEISISPTASKRTAFVQRSFCGGFAPHKLLIRFLCRTFACPGNPSRRPPDFIPDNIFIKSNLVVMSTQVSTRTQPANRLLTAAEKQRLALEAVAAQRRWAVAAVYDDAGISGAKGRDKRPGLDQMLKDATRRKFDVVMAWSADRLGRSLAAIQRNLGQLNPHPKPFVWPASAAAIRGFPRDRDLFSGLPLRTYRYELVGVSRGAMTVVSLRCEIEFPFYKLNFPSTSRIARKHRRKLAMPLLSRCFTTLK